MALTAFRIEVSAGPAERRPRWPRLTQGRCAMEEPTPPFDPIMEIRLAFAEIRADLADFRADLDAYEERRDHVGSPLSRTAPTQRPAAERGAQVIQFRPRVQTS